MFIIIDKCFKLRPVSIVEPPYTLGSKIKHMVLPNGMVAWGLNSSKFIQSADEKAQEYFKSNLGDRKLTKMMATPFDMGHSLEVDESPELDPVMANHYKSHIGISRWCV
jgi:hypothetical protein